MGKRYYLRNKNEIEIDEVSWCEKKQCLHNTCNNVTPVKKNEKTGLADGEFHSYLVIWNLIPWYVVLLVVPISPAPAIHKL